MILKRFLTYLGMALLVTACYQFKEPKKPKNLISKEKMVDILIDSKIIGSSNITNRRIMENHGVDLKTYVFKKHNIDSLQFVESNTYYTFHIKEYNEIYQKVKDSLEVLKVFYQNLEKKEIAAAKAKRKQDSLQVITTIKDSISNLKITDSLKTQLTKKVLKDSSFLNKKVAKFIDKTKNLSEQPSKKLQEVIESKPKN
ncbi:DUF4296 domain-containing protein [Algibacter pacificus]|uniref:DUF4296 domain-containing protein n=1 Tax=Algibacter pacificus TaxID=2599389 RepID=UPI0011CC6383|nr:DUF4296 domain-containing protein [Algibacter pacificus]